MPSYIPRDKAPMQAYSSIQKVVMNTHAGTVAVDSTQCSVPSEGEHR